MEISNPIFGSGGERALGGGLELQTNVLEGSWRRLGGSLSRLGGSWRALGASWARWGRSWRRFGRCWGGPGGKYGASWTLPGSSWSHLGSSGSHVAATWRPKGSQNRSPRGSKIEQFLASISRSILGAFWAPQNHEKNILALRRESNFHKIANLIWGSILTSIC